MKKCITYMAMGAMAVIMYQEIKNGNLQKFIDKKMKAEKKALDDLENML